jgi:hypothetical protein
VQAVLALAGQKAAILFLTLLHLLVAVLEEITMVRAVLAVLVVAVLMAAQVELETKVAFLQQKGRMEALV